MLDIETSRNSEVPYGWRKLKEGEIIKSGDYWWNNRTIKWERVNSTGGRWNPIGFWTIIRKAEMKGS